MRKLMILCLTLGACAADPGPERPTWRDAAEEIAYGQCSRWVECGTEQGDWQSCVDDLVYTFCDDIAERTGWETRCSDPYTGDFEEVSRCAMWYAQVTCGTFVPQCAL